MGCVGARHRPGQPQRPQRFRRAGFHAENVLGQKLGAGAYASVYAVTQAQGEARRCAAKVVGSGSSGSQTTAEMAAREVEILRKVTETGSNFVVHLIDSFSEDAFTYIVMEMCDHTFLQALRSLGAHTEDTYRPLFRQMMQGLAAIHAAGVVHRDVKPDNFMCSGVGPERVVKLCDFGLAQAVTDASRNKLRGINGTAPFLAPEMVQGRRYNDKVDVWSLGVIVYLLLFGHLPYRPLLWTEEDMHRVIREGLPAPSFAPRVHGHADAALADAISIPAEDLVLALLHRSPRERPSASQALEHHYFSRATAGRAPSLRPMLDSAEYSGAFDLLAGEPRHCAPSDLDAKLASLQALHGHRGAFSRQTTATLELASEDCGSSSMSSWTPSSP